jgi:hypothetical protein
VPEAEEALEARIPESNVRVMRFELPVWPQVAAIVENSRRADAPVCVENRAFGFLFSDGVVCTPSELSRGVVVVASAASRSAVPAISNDVIFANESVVLTLADA